MEHVIALRKTAFTIHDADGDMLDEWGHIYFAKDIALAKAREIGGMYHPVSNRTSVKEVVTGYTEA